MTLVSNWPSPKRRKGRLLCGARTRAGGCCQVRAEPGRARCRFHGGKSTGPKTEAGRNRIAEAQRQRWRARRSEVATKPDLEGNYLGPNTPRYVVMPNKRRRQCAPMVKSRPQPLPSRLFAVDLSSAGATRAGCAACVVKASCTSGFGCRPILVNILSFRQHTKSEAGLGG